MSWIEQVQRGITITTGDGETYQPSYLNASFQTEYQSSTFEFIGVDGSLVKKTTKIGTRYNLEIYFQGTDHLDVVKKFIRSCSDKRPWTVDHPLYDILTVQVPSLNCDDAFYDPSKITGTMIETLPDGEAMVFVIPIDQIPLTFADVTAKYTDALTETPQPQDITQLNNDNVGVYKRGVPVIPGPEEFETFTNLFSTASSYIDTATATPLLMMSAVMRVITAPSQFLISTQTRVKLLQDTMDNLRANILGFLTVSSKQLFQNKQGACLGALCVAAGSPLGADYKNAVTILSVIDVISARRAQYIADLDSLQTATGGDVTSFVPDAAALIAMNDLVNTTIAALYSLSLSARSERSIVCEKDTNWIVLAHRLYGLDQADANVNDLIEQNASPLDINLCEEHLQVDKGRRVVYYI